MGTAYKSCCQRRHRGQDKAEIITPLSPGTVGKRSVCMGGVGAESTRSIHCSIERVREIASTFFRFKNLCANTDTDSDVRTCFFAIMMISSGVFFIMTIMGIYVGLFIYYAGLFIYHGYDTKYILGRKTLDLCVGRESGIIG